MTPAYVKTGISKGVRGPIEGSNDLDLVAIRSVCHCSNRSRFKTDCGIRRSGVSSEPGCSVLLVLAPLFDAAEAADNIRKGGVGGQLLLAVTAPRMPYAGHQYEEVDRFRFGTHRLRRLLRGVSGESPLRNAGYWRSAGNWGVGRPSEERRSRYSTLKTAG
jgi:hypothetical protein